MNHMKNLKTAEDLICYMKTKGIHFDICSEKDACRFLMVNSYYKKVSCYQDNFQYGISNGIKRYSNLDFAYLQELSILDMAFRNLVMGMCLNLEHSLKVEILQKCLTAGDNGYQLMNDYFLSYSKAHDDFSKLTTNPYCKELVSKYKTDTPVWVYLEVVSFGLLCSFNRWLAKERSITDYSDIDILFGISRFRNAAAHNYCILNHLTKRDNCIPKPRVRNFVKTIAPPGYNVNERLKPQCVHDFFSLLYAFDKYVKSNGVRTHTIEDINQLFNIRMVRHAEYFKSCDPIIHSYKFSKLALDNWFNS